jgi:hypothetical protein
MIADILSRRVDLFSSGTPPPLSFLPWVMPPLTLSFYSLKEAMLAYQPEAGARAGSSLFSTLGATSSLPILPIIEGSPACLWAGGEVRSTPLESFCPYCCYLLDGCCLPIVLQPRQRLNKDYRREEREQEIPISSRYVLVGYFLSLPFSLRG